MRLLQIRSDLDCPKSEVLDAIPENVLDYISRLELALSDAQETVGNMPDHIDEAIRVLNIYKDVQAAALRPMGHEIANRENKSTVGLILMLGDISRDLARIARGETK